MNEIGIDKFYVELLESQIENYDEMEIYYINKLNTRRPNGYNLAKGGSSYPNLSGIEHFHASITSQNDLDAIINELKNTNYSLTEIAKHFNVSFSVIQKINDGETYKQDGIKYPIKRCVLSEEKFNRLVYDLKYSNHSYKKLGKLYGISTNQVKTINAGRSWHKDYLNYPIRKTNFSDSSAYGLIQKDLLSTNIEYEDLSKKYDCSLTTIRRINLGETSYNENLKYPLRKTGKLSSDDVYKIHILLIDDDMSINEIATMFNTSVATIKRINSGKTKKYIDERFSYPLRK